MYKVSFVHYPNAETRCVFSQLPATRKFSYDDSEDKNTEKRYIEACHDLDSASLLDIRSELDTTPLPVENCWGKPSKPGWGDLPRWTAYTLHARRTILRIGGVLDQVANHPSEVLFLTGTIPNGYDDGRITASAYSAWLVHSLKNWVNKHVSSKYDFYVWEFQKRGVLHLHYAVWVKDSIKREYLKENFKKQWINLLLRLSEAVQVDMLYSSEGGSSKTKTESVQAYAQEVRASCVAYLAKYSSKDYGKDGRLEGVLLYPPTRWYGCSRPLLKHLRELTEEKEILFISQRKALTLYQDVATMLLSTSEKGYEYSSKYTYSFTAVAYQSSIIGLEECRTLMTNLHQSKSSNDCRNCTERIHTQLKAIARKFGISPHKFSTQYTPSAGIAMERLFNGQSLSIIEAMEICDGLVWLLWYLFPNRGRSHVDYPRAKERLTEIKTTLNYLYQEKGHKLTDEIPSKC